MNSISSGMTHTSSLSLVGFTQFKLFYRLTMLFTHIFTFYKFFVLIKSADNRTRENTFKLIEQSCCVDATKHILYKPSR